MQFFVYCKHPGHTNEKIYIRFEREPQVRAEIPFWTFQMTCPQGSTNTYYKNEVHAEVGLEPVGGAILGGLLFLVDPVAGVIGAGAGYAAVKKAEDEKVKKFEASVG